MAHGHFEGIMKEMVLLLDIWLWEAHPLSSITNDLLFVPVIHQSFTRMDFQRAAKV
jgi:hypothetical protein